MLNKDNQRELAYLVKIDSIAPIEGRDRVECAVVGGWTVMVQKGLYLPGDVAVYFEIDSKVPDNMECFAFLEKYHYKVKTQKFKKFYSQGLLMSAKELGWTMEYEDFIDTKGVRHKVGDESRFVTKELGVVYAVEEDNKRKSNGDPNAKYKAMAGRYPKLFQFAPVKWLYKRTWGKKLLFVFFGKKKDKKKDWPIWVRKTDEERVENMAWILTDKEPWFATEKVDGTSTTFTMKRGRFGKNDFYICSRNVVFDKPDKACFYDTNVYVEMAQKYDIENVLKVLLDTHKDAEWVTIQGETYGAGVQKRDYGMTDRDFKAFNLIFSNTGRVDSQTMIDTLSGYGVPCIDIVDDHYILPDTIEELRTFVHSEKSRIDGGMREGIVFRDLNGEKSFKCVDPEFLLKYHG